MEEDQGGHCIIGYRGTSFELFTLKQRRVDDASGKHLHRTQHKNICNLVDFYHASPDQVHFIYEDMPVSLSEIQSCPSASLVEYEVAAVVHEVGEHYA
jgi:hypothetical protein